MSESQKPKRSLWLISGYIYGIVFGIVTVAVVLGAIRYIWIMIK